VLLYVAVGVLYESLVSVGWGAMMSRFPRPYAVPICQDTRSAGMGTTLWLTALLGLSHVLAQPDYPANAGVNAGIAPYLFFLSHVAGLAGIGLAAHWGERSFPLTGRGRLVIVGGDESEHVIDMVGRRCKLTNTCP